MTAPTQKQARTVELEPTEAPRERTLLDKIIEETARFRRDVEPLREFLTSAAPKWFDVNRIYAGLDAAIAKEPKILKADKKSLYIALAKVARWGLDIGDGVDLVVQQVNRKDEAGNWQKIDAVDAWPDYKGLKALAIRNGLIRNSAEYLIYEGDEFTYEQGEHGTKFRHMVRPRAGRKIVAAYSQIALPMGRNITHLVWFEEIEAKRTKSRGWNDEALQKKREPIGCPEWYAKKCAIRDYLNRQPKASVIGAALNAGEDLPPGVTVDGVLDPPLPPEVFNQAKVGDEYQRSGL